MKKKDRKEHKKYDKRQNLNLLCDFLFKKYDYELARKDRLESKAIGFYSVLGIYLAAFLVLEPEMLKSLEFSNNRIVSHINFILIVFFVLNFIVEIIFLHKVYNVKRRNEADILSQWDMFMTHTYLEVVESIRYAMEKTINNLEEQNIKSAKYIKCVSWNCIFSSIIIIIIFALYFYKFKI